MHRRSLSGLTVPALIGLLAALTGTVADAGRSTAYQPIAQQGAWQVFSAARAMPGLDRPTGIADTGNNRIVVLSPVGRILTTWPVAFLQPYSSPAPVIHPVEVSSPARSSPSTLSTRAPPVPFEALRPASFSTLSNPLPPASTSSWAQPYHDAAHTNFNPSEHSIGPANASNLHPVWSARAGLLSNTLIVANGLVAIIGGQFSSRVVQVLDAQKGALVHTFTPAALGLTGSRIVHPSDQPELLAYAQGRLIIAADTEVIAVNPWSGRVWWRASVPGGSGLLVASSTLYTSNAGCMNGCSARMTSAIDLGSGRVRWTYHGSLAPVLAAGRYVYEEYEAGMGGQIESFIFDSRTGHQIGRLPVGMIPMTAHGSNVYAQFVTMPCAGHPVRPVGCPTSVMDFSVLGTRKWSVPLSGFPLAEVALAYHTLYLFGDGNQGGAVRAMSPDTGRTLWTVHVAGGWGLGVANHLIFLRQTVGAGKSQHDRLLVMDARTHRIVRTLNVPLLGAAGVIAAGHVYLSGIVRPTGTRLIALAPGHRNLRSVVGPKLSQVSVLPFPGRDNTNWPATEIDYFHGPWSLTANFQRRNSFVWVYANATRRILRALACRLRPGH